MSIINRESTVLMSTINYLEEIRKSTKDRYKRIALTNAIKTIRALILESKKSS